MKKRMVKKANSSYVVLLKCCIKEKFGLLYPGLFILLFLSAMIPSASIGLSLAFVIILFTSLQITRIFCEKTVNCINTGFSDYVNKSTFYGMLLSITVSFPFLLCLLLTNIINYNINFLALCLFWLYAVCWGAFLGGIVSRELTCYITALIVFLICIQKLLIHELYLRYISPMLIANGELNIFNILFIAIISLGVILAFLIPKNIGKKWIVIFVLINCASFTVLELAHEKRLDSYERKTVIFADKDVAFDSGIDEEKAKHASKLLIDTDLMLEEYGFDENTAYYDLKRSVYFPWESAASKTLFRKDENHCFVNYYTDSLYSDTDENFVRRYIYSLISSENQFQEVGLEILTDDIVSRIVYGERGKSINDYSYERIVNDYGYVASPKQVMFASCILNDPKVFSKLYSVVGTIKELGEVDIRKLSGNKRFVYEFEESIK